MMPSKNKPNIVIISSFAPPITGASVITEKIESTLLKEYDVQTINTSVFDDISTDTSSFSFQKVWKYVKLYTQSTKLLKAKLVYLSMGMSFYGALRDMIFIFFARLLGKKVLIHLHGNLPSYLYAELGGVKRALYSMGFRMATKGIVLSKSLRNNLSPFLPPEDIFELKNYVDNGLIITPNEKETTDHTLRIIYLSNLIKEKGILDLLEALLLLHRRNIPFDARIAGGMDKKHKEKIEHQLAQMPSNCVYEGVLESDRKKELLTWGNVLVLPTFYRTEGQPVSILEGLVTGNVIVTTDQGGIKDIFTDSVNGFFVEKKNPTDIADKLEFLSKNPTKREAIQKANFKLQEKYSEVLFEKNLLEIFKATME